MRFRILGPLEVWSDKEGWAAIGAPKWRSLLACLLVRPGQLISTESLILELWGDSVRTAPRGYPKDHERIDLLRRKSLTLGARLAFGHGIDRDAGLDFVADTWRAAGPVTGWLDAHVGPSGLPVARAGRP